MQQQALAQQQKMFGTAQNALNPYIQTGQSVLPTLQGLITPGANQNALLAQTPGFQFASQYGTMAAKNALSAQGLGASAGPVATAVSQYNNGLAQNTWGSVVGALQNAAGLGGNAAGALASGAIASGNAQANTLTGIGQSQAAGILGSGNAISGGIIGSTNALSSAALYNYFGNGGGGLYSALSGPAYGGGNVVTDAYGGNPDNPLDGLTSEDYGPGR
jgi:hypothetical protein